MPPSKHYLIWDLRQMFMDMHNDSAYTAELNTEYGIKKASEKAEDATRLREELDERLSGVAKTLAAAVTPNEVNKVYGLIAREGSSPQSRRIQR